MKPIALLGGTFDPIHHGHIALAKAMLQEFACEEVRLIPSFIPPHRNLPIASAQDRLQMLKLAVRDNPKLIPDDREIHRKNISYMIDTLISLRQEFPDQVFILGMGIDAFAKFDHWHRWQELINYAHIAIVNREEDITQQLGLAVEAAFVPPIVEKSIAEKNYALSKQRIANFSEELKNFYQQNLAQDLNLLPNNLLKNNKIHTIHMPNITISATQIRENLKQGKSVEKYLSSSVINYIFQHKLYK